MQLGNEERNYPYDDKKEQEPIIKRELGYL